MGDCLLVDVLLNPDSVVELTLSDWDVLIPQAKVTGLVASLYHRIMRCEILHKVPERPRAQLYSTWLVHLKQKQSVGYELRWLRKAYGDASERLLLLKGAAYIASGLPAAEGRLMSDIDLLVPEKNIARVESVLNDYGWLPGRHSAYDERYYRKWMHEIPPLGHEERESTLDVHHTILPPTSRVKLQPDKLFADAIEVSDGLFSLSPADMVLHSAAHLFHEGEFQHGLRDLWDLDRLLRFWAESDAFWEKLITRAEELGLMTPLFYGVRYTAFFFKTPIPDEINRKIIQWRPGKVLFPLVDFMFRQAFVPNHSSCKRRCAGVSEFLLYVRSHYLRMPLYLLIPHLARKAWVGFFDVGNQQGEFGETGDEGNPV